MWSSIGGNIPGESWCKSFADNVNWDRPPTNSRCQDDYVFRLGNPYKPSFAIVAGREHPQIFASS